MADIVLINPRFEVSFWGLEHALPFIGKSAVLPVAALPLLAALTPEGHRLTIIDENVEPIDFARCAEADIVGVTGMVVQRIRMREILGELKARGAFTVVGGPWVSVSEDYFGDLADVVFVGEAEETWPRFLEEWQKDRAAALRSVEDAALRLRQRPVLAWLPVPMRVLRHHRRVRPAAAAQDLAADHRRIGGIAAAAFVDRLHRRRQPDRQQARDQGGAARCDPMAAGERLPADLRHRGLNGPRR